MNLLEFRHNITSQYGEDGILRRIFEVLGVERGTCVEFGAWDGKLNSNTYQLITQKNWRGLLIEGNTARFADLTQTYAGRSDLYCRNAIVGFEAPYLLDDYVAQTDFPRDYDLLSIDVDGNDHHIFQSITKYHPKVVVVEFNATIHNHIVFIQERNLQVCQGSSAAAIVQLGKSMGYELVCCTDCNVIFVAAEYFPLFEIADNSLAALHQDTRYLTYLMQSYDGTLRLAGVKRLIWHNIPIDEARLQVLPKEQRSFCDKLS